MQTAQILPLAFGLVPEDRRAALAARLADDIVKARGGHAYVGVLGARYVLPVLTETGHHDLACAVATQTDEPSWGYWTDVAGFTALGEHWPATTRSRNHHFFGAIVQWLYEDLAGIRPAGAGLRDDRVQARDPGAPASTACRPPTRACEGRWPRAGAAPPTGLELDVIVPANATGRVYVPAHRPEAVTEAGAGKAVVAAEAASVQLVGVEGDRVVYDVGSGRYQFRVAALP